MIQLILFLLVGAMLFLSLYLLVRRSSHAEGSAEELLEARQALVALQLGLLPHETVRRIFATEDLDYVTSETPECIREFFLEERKGIALSWACQVRRQLLSLRQFHLGSARFYAQLNFRTEIRLAAEFAALLLACRALQLTLFLRGPYAAPRVVDSDRRCSRKGLRHLREVSRFSEAGAPHRHLGWFVRRPGTSIR